MVPVFMLRMSEETSLLLAVFDVSLSFLLCTVCILGYCVFHIQMSVGGQARILNHLYSIYAYINQAQSLLIFSLILSDHLWPHNLILKCLLVNIRALFALIALQTVILLTLGHLFSHHNPFGYLELSVKMESKHKWLLVLAMVVFSITLMFIIIFSNGLENPCESLKEVANILAIFFAISLILLLSLVFKSFNQEFIALIRSIQKKSNSVSPINPEEADMHQQQQPVYQVQYFYRIVIKGI